MDIHQIRKDPNFFIENEKKRFNNNLIVESILETDERWKQITYDIDQLRAFKNKLSMAFKSAPAKQTVENDNLFEKVINNKEIDISLLTRNQLKELGRELNDLLQQKEHLKDKLTETRDNHIQMLGNILHENVPISNNEDNNQIVFSNIKDQNDESNNNQLDHINLCKKLNIIDTESGSLVAGNRGYFLKGWGVKLNMALLNYAIDFLMKKEYQMMQTPHMVENNLMSKITQLSEYQETLYKLDGYDKYLIATSEQPMTAYFNNKVINKKDLPIKYGGLSTCYRKEAGNHKNMGGIFRVHQFEKVEQFCVTEPNKSWEIFHEMIKTSMEFYDTLNLQYRVVNIVSGALNNAASMKYDLEVWFPGSKFYGELVSCTNCLDYFSRRLNTKLIGTKEYVHMLNCTLMANTRTICAILETHQKDDGISVPEPLIKYIGIDFIKFEN